MTIPADLNMTLFVDDAINAFRSWTSTELLNNQYRWLGAESKSQSRKKTENIEARARGVG
jgi:hypothetical protein